jgi:AraC-like DNA-binding protein
MNRERALSRSGVTDINGIQDKIVSIVGSLECNMAPRANALPSSIIDVRLGSLGVLRYDGYGLRRWRRSCNHVRENKIDNFLAVFPLSAPLPISQSGRSAIAERGTAILLTTNKPFEGLCSEPDSDFVVRLPGSLLRQHVPHIDECCARPIAMQCGAGKMLRSLIEFLVEDRNDYSASQADRFGDILLDTFVNVAMEAPELTEFQDMRREPAHSRVFECAKAFIESNLSNPELDPAMVAEHCHISVSYLHAAFAASSQRVGAYIRENRLQRCREALRNPAQRHKSITEIAMRWGFNCCPSFNRAYRAQFGKSPSEDRAASSSF